MPGVTVEQWHWLLDSIDLAVTQGRSRRVCERDA